MAGHFCANTIVDLAGKLESAARQKQSANYREMAEELIVSTRKLVDYLQNRKGKIYE
jgi:hypothetical protein